MNTSNHDVLDEHFKVASVRRRDLLPLWIKIFCWIFMAFGLLIPVALFMGLSGMEFSLSLYGIETYHPISGPGLLIIALFTIKAVTGFGLWTERKWAINLAIADAMAGIAFCVFAMLLLPLFTEGHLKISFRLELLLLIPYLIKLLKIKKVWEGTPGQL